MRGFTGGQSPWRKAVTALAVLPLAACDLFVPAMQVPVPPERPADLIPAVATPLPPSDESRALARYYTAVQNDLLTRGLLRIDGGGPDTPFTPDTLARNFETIAFYDEYSRSGSGTIRSNRVRGRLSRWDSPVRIGVEYGPSVPLSRRARDQARIDTYVPRLARITGHPVALTERNQNFHVFVAGEDDRAFLETRLQQLIPRISRSELDIFLDLPRSIYCLVVAFSSADTPQTYTRAVALIRAEHPDLVRQACIHEELAQGLGLANDSPAARPSIFNDDDEFALLTTHDELLLQMLYDPRLRPGMTADQARPVSRIIARDLMGQAL